MTTTNPPIKVHIISHTYMIQGFVSDGLYQLVSGFLQAL